MHIDSRLLKAIAICSVLGTFIVSMANSVAGSGQDRDSLKVPGGLAFSEFKGFESWEVVSVSLTDEAVAVIVGNPAMIGAYKAGIPANGMPVPDGAKMAKIHWNPRKSEAFPNTTVPGALHDIDFMVKDARRFADSGGWGYGAFEYDGAADRFRPATTADSPPQANDAKCGAACHTLVKKRDFVFTEFGHR